MWKKSFTAALPVVTAYLPLGAAFGVLWATELELPWWTAALMGIFVFAGSAQFLAVGMLAKVSTPLAIGIAALLLNSRHVFYSIAFLEKYRNSGWLTPYLFFGLTDETFSVLTVAKPPAEEQHRFYFQVTFINHVAWVLGCAAGAWVGSQASIDSKGFEFVLTALFLVATIEQFRILRSPRPFVSAALAAAVALALFPNQFLLAAIALSTLILLATRRGVR